VETSSGISAPTNISRVHALRALKESMPTLFHGAVGYLDELLALGIVLAIGAIIYFVFVMIELRSSSTKDNNEAH
jgi:hypothetical protein